MRRLLIYIAALTLIAAAYAGHFGAPSYRRAAADDMQGNATEPDSAAAVVMSPDGPLEIADSVWGREYLAPDSLLRDSLHYNDSTAYVDSLGWQLPNDRQSLFADDSLPGTGDRTRLSKIVRDKVDLDGSVQFSAKDSLIMLGNNNAYLYGEGKVEYQAFKLASAEIRMELDSSTVYATGVYDSLGNLSGTPVFQDGVTEYESKQMKYNFST
ncbi:MAG: hypothetical protein K2H75_02655, partial [Muribaculaceae bacterium]|nr:hypothetical protein [Muribaculaceae bacterium]